MNPLLAFLPIDRLHALARGATLPERAAGSVLFADVSGFTPLAAALVRDFGPRRGAEELTRRLNSVYELLIAAVHRRGGSVVGFTGDAITCFFDDEGRGSGGPAGVPALQAALDMQQAMAGGSALSVRVAVESGPVRRMLVGHTSVQLLDVVAGATVDRLGMAAHAAARGEVIAGPGVLEQLGDRVRIAGRRDSADGLQLALVTGVDAPHAEHAWPDHAFAHLDDTVLTPWLLPAVAERLKLGMADFLAELRSATAVLVKFGGLDYDRDPNAGAKLDQFVKWAQEVVNRAEGAVIDVTASDKGNCIYAAFGAPVSHEDDSRRAVDTALALCHPPSTLGFIAGVQIGVSRGRMRTGPYGSTARRTYGVLGDETNVAARLMEAAAPGTVLVSQAVVDTDQRPERFGTRLQLTLKGRDAPVVAFEATASASPLRHQKATSDFIGRASERTRLARRLDDLRTNGTGGVVAVEGEPGIGKSRLIAELAAMAEASGLRVITGAAVAVERSTPYYAWRSIVSALFTEPGAGDGQAGLRDRVVEAAGRDPVVARLSPLLQAFLPIALPDNEFTSHMTAEARAEGTHELIVHLLSQLTWTRGGLLIIFEDAHWHDSATWALARRVARDVPALLMVISTRPMPARPPDYDALMRAHQAETISLGPMPAEDVLALVTHRLGATALPAAVAGLIRDKAQGNPFFSEELAFALRDRHMIEIGTDRQCHLKAGVDLSALAFPDTVDGVVTSRIDQLSASQQLTLKLASVIGRTFRLETLAAVHPSRDAMQQLEDDLATLQRLEITPIQTPDPEREYVFKHVIIQEVAYNLLLFTQRRALHRGVAEWYERAHAGDLPLFYALLAHHWGSAQVGRKTIHYLEQAGDQALANDANEEATRFLEGAIALVERPRDVSDDPEAEPGEVAALRRAGWDLSLGDAQHRLGRLSESENYFRAGLRRLGYPVPQSEVSLVGGAVTEVARQAAWRLWPGRSPVRQPGDDTPALAYRGYERLAELAFLHGRAGLVLYGTLRALNLAEVMGPSSALSQGYSAVCVASGVVPVHRLARYYLRKATAVADQLNDPAARADMLLTTSIYQAGAGDLEAAAARMEEAADLFEKFGNFHRWGICLQTRCRVAWSMGRLDRFAALTHRLHATGRRREDLLQQVWGLNNEAEYLLMSTNEAARALDLLAESLTLIQQCGEEAAELIARVMTAWAHTRLGQSTQAAEAIDATLTLVTRAARPTSFGMLCAYATLADVCVSHWAQHSAGASSPARQWALAACRALDQFAGIFPIGRPRAALHTGRRLWLIGRKAKAEHNWREAAAHAKRLGMPFDEGLALYEWGTHLPSGDPRRQALLARAHALFAGMSADYERARTAAAMAG